MCLKAIIDQKLVPLNHSVFYTMIVIAKLFFLLLSVLGVFFFRPHTGVNNNVKHLPPSENLSLTHFGFRLIMADYLWLEYIQFAFDCSKYVKEGRGCTQRWGFKTLDEATELDPKFQELYYHGAVKLSVLLDDHIGAGELFERGVKFNKDSWLIHYRAAYVNMTELDRPKKAADYMLKASELGAPFWTKSLASKLYNKSGEIELGYRLLSELYEEAEEGPWKEDLEKRLNIAAKELRKNSKSF